MLTSDNTFDATPVDITLSTDFELNGEINRSSSQGAKFALLMAMLEPDSIHRPRLEQSKTSENAQIQNDGLHHYRASALSATEKYWLGSGHTGKLIEQGYLGSAHLWLAMHPEPLSLKNNALEVDEETLANASLFAQHRMKKKAALDIKVDETGLYDILNQLKTPSS